MIDQSGNRATRTSDPRRDIALIVGIVAAIGFGLFRAVISPRQPLAIDVWWHGVMVANLTPMGVIVAWIPSIVGGTIGMIVIGLVIIGLFLWRKRRWDAANLAIAMVVVVAIGAPLSYVIARVRPGDSLAETTVASFPSGHTAVATTVIVTLGLILRRWWVWAGGVVWVIWMMWARTYLHAHWLTDVFAGLLEGTAVATLVWCAVQAVRDRRAVRSGQESPSASGAHA